MHFSDLETIVCLAEVGRFSWAAERLGRSQPAVSMAIRRLESEFGARLLGRNSHRVVPTEAGARVLAMARRILQLRERALEDLRHLEGPARGRLRLIANELLCSHLLPPLLEAFHAAAPGVRVEVAQGASTDVLRGLLDQDFDFGFLTFAPESGELSHQSLFTDPLVLCVPAGHPLERQPKVSWAHLACWPILAHARPTLTRKRLDYQMSQSGAALRFAMELPTLETLKRFVAAGMGIAILPRMCLEAEVASGTLRALPLPGPTIARDIRMAHRDAPGRSAAAQAFLGLVQARFSLPPGVPAPSTPRSHHVKAG